MAGVTHRGMAQIMSFALRNLDSTGGAIPTNFYIILCVAAGFPASDVLRADIETLADVTRIPVGTGYQETGAGSAILARDATDFDSVVEDGLTKVSIQIKDIVWTASGGSIPTSGLGARWAVLTDDNASIAAREVYAWWDLVSDRTVTTGQTLTLQNLQIDAVE